MIQLPQHRWQPSNVKKLLWVAGFAAALAFAFFVLCGYLFEWKWTGLPKQKLWDWLDLLIVPIVLVLGGFLFTRFENNRTQKIAQKQRELDRAIADERTESDREIARQRRHDDTLQAYLAQIGELLLDEMRPLRDSKADDVVRTLARARTLTVLEELGPAHKVRVLEFLFEADLIRYPETDPEEIIFYPMNNLGPVYPIISLRGANLKEIEWRSLRSLERICLEGADLSGATIGDANTSMYTRGDIEAVVYGGEPGTIEVYGRLNLRDASLIDANLTNADLSFTDLSSAFLSSAKMKGANLMSTNLSKAYLNEAYLAEADLSEADLQFAQITVEQLKQCKSLEGATMPDGQRLKNEYITDRPTFEDWLKSQDRK